MYFFSYKLALQLSLEMGSSDDLFVWKLLKNEDYGPESYLLILKSNNKRCFSLRDNILFLFSPLPNSTYNVHHTLSGKTQNIFEFGVQIVLWTFFPDGHSGEHI